MSDEEAEAVMAFVNKWRECDDLGLCDSLGGAECQRVFQQWWIAGRPLAGLSKLIAKWANCDRLRVFQGLPGNWYECNICHHSGNGAWALRHRRKVGHMIRLSAAFLEGNSELAAQNPGGQN